VFLFCDILKIFLICSLKQKYTESIKVSNFTGINKDRKIDRRLGDDWTPCKDEVHLLIVVSSKDFAIVHFSE
jgi:hypothetical protein